MSAPTDKLPSLPPNGRVRTRAHPRSKGGHSHGRHHVQHRVRDLLRSAVVEGLYSSEDQLIEDVLVHTHAASRNAVRFALQSLLAEGVVTRDARRGTYPSWDGARVHMVDIRSVGGDHSEALTGELIERSLVPATSLLQGKLRTEAATLQMVENSVKFRGEIIGIRTAYFSSEYDVADLVARQPPGIDSLAKVIAVMFTRDLGYVTTEVSAALVDVQTARVLDIREGSPVLRREQLVHDCTGQPVEVVFDCFRADRATLILPDFDPTGRWPGPIALAPPERL